jgi:hypothetical protein
MFWTEYADSTAYCLYSFVHFFLVGLMEFGIWEDNYIDAGAFSDGFI